MSAYQLLIKTLEHTQEAAVQPEVDSRASVSRGGRRRCCSSAFSVRGLIAGEGCVAEFADGLEGVILLGD